jgi:predicted ribosomally synthesized peptide with SipW-like signal peptide
MYSKKNSSRKVLAVLLCVVLLIGGAIGGTLAYFTDADVAKNVFTVGNVQIALDETIPTYDEAKNEWVKTDKRTDETNTTNTYKILPGTKVAKDPTITVIGGSEEAYIRSYADHFYGENAHKAERALRLMSEITRKDEWMEFSFDYTVYEPVFGELGKQKKSFYINCFGRGNEDLPIYFADLKCEETVTDVVFGKKYVVYEKGPKPLNLGESEIECPKAPWSK